MGPPVLVVGFPGGQFNGSILPAPQDVVEKDIVSIVDGLLITKNEDGSVEFTEIAEVGSSEDVAKLQELFDEVNGLLNDEEYAAAKAKLLA